MEIDRSGWREVLATTDLRVVGLSMVIRVVTIAGLRM